MVDVAWVVRAVCVHIRSAKVRHDRYVSARNTRQRDGCWTWRWCSAGHKVARGSIGAVDRASRGWSSRRLIDAVARAGAVMYMIRIIWTVSGSSQLSELRQTISANLRVVVWYSEVVVDGDVSTRNAGKRY